MKKISKKLLLSVFSLLLMATVLGTSTYAWFTIGDTVTVSKFDMDVQGGLGLEVAYVYAEEEDGREGFVTRLTADRIYEYLSKDYYGDDGDFEESFKMGDVTSIDGDAFKYLSYKDEGAGSYGLEEAKRKSEGFIEFTLRFRTKEADAVLIWETASLESAGVDDWVPGFKFNAPDGDGTEGTLIDPDPEDGEYIQYKYYASHAARISVTGNLTGEDVEKTKVYELAEIALGTGDSPGYLNTVLSDSAPNWTQGNLQYFKESTDYDLSEDFGSSSTATYKDYKAAKTFTKFEENEDVVVAKFGSIDGENEEGYYYADVTIRVYIEGFDAEAFDSILKDKLSVMLRFTFKKSSEVNSGDNGDD